MTQQGHQSHLKNKGPKSKGAKDRAIPKETYVPRDRPEKPKKENKTKEKTATKAEKRRNRSLLKYVRNNHTKGGRTYKEAVSLYKSLRQHGLASTATVDSIMTPGIDRQTVHADMQTHGQLSVPPAVTTFQASLIYPGYYDSPFIDESHICPCPHGVSHGTLSYSASNSEHHIFFVAPALASALSTSLATQKSGFGTLSPAYPASTITADNITGAGGTWVQVFGNTTASKKIFAWSGRVEISLQIPEAVVQGIVYVGNAPASMVIGATTTDLIRMSSEAQGEAGGATYVIRSSIVELGLAHAPYSTYSTTDLPQDERVSWIIFSPSSMGSLSGSPPQYYQLNALCHTNYYWVPTYQPQVVGSTEAQVKAEASIQIPPKDREAVSTAVQKTSVSSTMSEILGKGAKIALAGSAAARIVGLFWAAALPISAGLGIAGSAMGAASGALAEPEPTISTISNALDVQYVLSSIIPRWGDWKVYPAPIYESIKIFEESANRLNEAFLKNEEVLVEYREDWNAACNTVVTQEGKRVWTKKLASGKTAEDYRQALTERLRSPSTKTMSEFSARSHRR